MNVLLALVPSRYRAAAKAWVAGYAAVLTAVVSAVPHLPKWLAVVVALSSALGVYATPNVQPEATE